MRRRTRVLSAVAGTLVLAAVGVELARGGDDQVSGPDAEPARAAATAAVPGGTAGEVERESDEPGITYGVEVTTPDDSRLEVLLSGRFAPVGPPEGDG